VGTVIRYSTMDQTTFRRLALLQNSGYCLSWYWTYLLLAQFNFLKRKKNRLLRSIYYVYLHFSFRKRWPIFTKLGMTTSQLENTLIAYFSTSYNLRNNNNNNNKHNNKVDGRICEVGSTLMPPMELAIQKLCIVTACKISRMSKDNLNTCDFFIWL